MSGPLEEKPLQGRTILITRSRSQAPSFSELLEEAGAKVLEIPTIEIHARPSAGLDPFIRRLGEYDWLFFTSVNGVQIFLDRALEVGIPDRVSMPRICTIGPATAKAVEERGFPVELVPLTFQAEGVLEEFDRYLEGQVVGLHILLPRASKAREILPRQLEERGARVDVVPVYDTVEPSGSGPILRRVLRSERPDLVTFTSSSTVHNFVSLADNDPLIRRLRYAAIGPIAAQTARGYGLNVVLEPKRSTVPDLAQAILEFFVARPE